MLFSSSLTCTLPLSPDHADAVGSSPPSQLLPHQTDPTDHKIPTVNQGVACKYHCPSVSPFLLSSLHSFTCSLSPSHPHFLPLSLLLLAGLLPPPPFPPTLHPFPPPFPLPGRRCLSTQSMQRRLTRTSKWHWSGC